MTTIRNLYNRCAQYGADIKHRFTENPTVKGLSAVYNHMAFKAVWNYIWPFRVTQAVWAQRRIVYPLILQQLIQAATLPLFPTAQTYLKDKGVDPAIATQLSDHEIRVRERTLGGMLHSYNDLPTLIGMMQMGGELSEPVQAFASLSNPLSRYAFGQFPVTMPEKDVTARQALALLANMSEDEQDAMENVPMTDEQCRLAIAFHEFSHCHTQNAITDFSKCKNDMEVAMAEACHRESDADARGYTAAVKAFDNPEIIKAMLYARALNEHADPHDTALYLDAVINKSEKPFEIDALDATSDVFQQLDIYSRTHDVGDSKIDRALALQDIMKTYPDILSPLAQHRAQLYIDAVQYFFPQQFADAQADRVFQELFLNEMLPPPPLQVAPLPPVPAP